MPTRCAGDRVSEGSRLSLENWRRAVNWRKSVIEVGRAELRVHGLRHTYASLSRRAGADLRLLQKAMGHASITVTAHTYADLFDDELDDIATALDSLDDSFPSAAADPVWPHFGPISAISRGIGASPRPHFNALTSINNVVARGGIEPPTFRFSGGLGSYIRVFLLVRLAQMPLIGPVGPYDPPVWPHIGRMA